MNAESARALKKLESKLKDYRQGRIDPVTKIYWDLHYRINLKMAVENTREESSILDVGCGAGSMMIDLAKVGRKCCGIDPLHELSLIPAQIKSREQNVPISLVRAFSENMPFGSRSFDAVSLFSTLQHVADQKKTLKEVRRVLKDRGVMLISVPMSKNLFNRFKRTARPEHFTKEYDLEGLKQTLVENNFEILRVRGCGAFPPLSHEALFVCHKLLGKSLTKKMIEALDIVGSYFPSTASSIIILCKVSK